MPVNWEIEFNVPFGDTYKPVRIYSLGEKSFEIFIDKFREGSIAWMRSGWAFHTHYNTNLTTADFIILADILEECCPFEFNIEWLETPTSPGRWPSPPRQTPHWAMLTYPKWPKVRHW